MTKPTTEPASIKLHTLYRARKHLYSTAVIERHRKTRGGEFPIPKIYQLTEIHDEVAEGSQWFRTEAAALRTAIDLGYETAESRRDELLAAVRAHDDGTGTLGTIVDQALLDNPAITADEIRFVVLDAKRDAETEAAR